MVKVAINTPASRANFGMTISESVKLVDNDGAQSVKNLHSPHFPSPSVCLFSRPQNCQCATKIQQHFESLVGFNYNIVIYSFGQ